MKQVDPFCEKYFCQLHSQSLILLRIIPLNNCEQKLFVAHLHRIGHILEIQIVPIKRTIYDLNAKLLA